MVTTLHPRGYLFIAMQASLGKNVKISWSDNYI